MSVQSRLSVAAASGLSSVGRSMSSQLHGARSAVGVAGASELVPVREVAREVGCSVRTVKRDCQRGLLPPAVNRRNRWYYTRADLAAYKEKLASKRGGFSPGRGVASREECEV